MIYGYFGVNGRGKTLTMVKDLKYYDLVFVNFTFRGYPHQLVVQDFDDVRLFYKLKAILDKYGSINLIKKGIKICLAIDEAGLVFPARAFKNLSKEEMFLFSQHRKMGGMDFRYTAQNSIMVDKVLRYNTAYSIYPDHFFNIFWTLSYEGYDKKKENFSGIGFYLRTKKLVSLYSTMEVVESTKYLFDNEGKYKEISEFIEGLKLPSNLEKRLGGDASRKSVSESILKEESDDDA
jgi:hypothetical protein